MVKPPFLQADDYFPVTPSDTEDIKDDAANPDPNNYQVVTLRINDVGEVTVTLISPYDADASRGVTFTVVGPADLPYVTKRVMAAGTSATNIIAGIKRL